MPGREMARQLTGKTPSLEPDPTTVQPQLRTPVKLLLFLCLPLSMKAVQGRHEAR